MNDIETKQKIFAFVYKNDVKNKNIDFHKFWKKKKILIYFLLVTPTTTQHHQNENHLLWILPYTFAPQRSEYKEYIYIEEFLSLLCMLEGFSKDVLPLVRRLSLSLSSFPLVFTQAVCITFSFQPYFYIIDIQGRIHARCA